MSRPDPFADLPTPPPPWNSTEPPHVRRERARGLLGMGDVPYALEVARAGAGRKGKAALEKYRRQGRPTTAEEAARWFLEAIQAAAEELDRLALAVAAGTGVSKAGDS
jgi:hypothetical protein